MNFVISRTELEKALEKLKIVSENGFKSSTPVFTFVSAGRSLDDNVAVFEDVILQVNPDDPCSNYGRTAGYEEAVFVDGKFGWK